MSMYCAPGTFPYTIQPGDTYWELADHFNVTIEAIMLANPYINPNNLLVGQVICMPIDPPPARGGQQGGQRGGERGGERGGQRGGERGGERREEFGRRPEEFGRRPYYPYYPYDQYNPYNPYYPYY